MALFLALLFLLREQSIIKIILKSQSQPREKSKTELFDFPRNINIFNLEITISVGKKTILREELHPFCHTLNSCHMKCGLQTCRGCVIWKVVRNVESKVLLQAQAMRMCMSTSSLGDSWAHYRLSSPSVHSLGASVLWSSLWRKAKFPIPISPVGISFG